MNRKPGALGAVSLAICCLVALRPTTARGACPVTSSVTCPPGATYDASADQCAADFHACVSGYAYSASSSQCEAAAPHTTPSAICPSGSLLDPFGRTCEAPNLSPCPAGHAYDATRGTCAVAATLTPADTCPQGYAFDAATARCVGPASSACAQGGSWGSYEQTCTSGGPLPGFTFDDETGLFIGPWSCPPAYAVDRRTGACSGPRVTASCPAGTTLDAATTRCLAAAGPACAAGQTYDASTARCDFAPVVDTAPSACPPGYVLNVDTGLCAGFVNSACPEGTSYGRYERACTSAEPRPGFGWDDETGQYVGPSSCPAGFTLLVASGSCSGAACGTGWAFDAAAGSCRPSGCPAGTVKSGELCVAAPVCAP